MLPKYKNNFLGYFQFYYKVIGNKMIVSSILSIIVSMLDAFGLAMFMPLLQSVGEGPQSPKDTMGYLHYMTDFITGMGFSLTLKTVLLTLVILFSLKGFAKFIELNYQAGVIQFFMKRVRHELINSLLKLSYKGFTQLDAGVIQNNFIAEVQRMSQAVRGYMAYSQALFMLLTYLIFAILANYQFAILVAISAGLTNLLYNQIYKRMKVASYEISKKGDNFNAYMIQAVHYFKYLKSTNYLSLYSKKLREVINKTEHLNKKIAYYNAVTVGLREPMILLIVALVIYVQLIMMGGNLGSIILSLILFYRALNYLVEVQKTWQTFIQNSGAMRSVTAISATMHEMTEGNGTKEFRSLTDDISIKNVSISYGSNKVLNQISIIIPKKQTIALVGESGSGKTTLANIVMGLINPDSGSILIGNVPLTAFDLNTYRDKMGYISQDSVIFNDTIYDNITFWAEPTPENYKRFWEVVQMASLKEFVEGLDEREQTKLGNNGILISGGQKQRISIAREMYKKAELLILDEATSALDSETELIIHENIEKLHGHYTMVVIAHRLSTIRNADMIYLLDKGKVVLSGNFDTMVKNSDKFRRMVSLQGMENKI
jgi:ABC-type multidrug transport system fused ATPase/permease subunit